MNHRRCGLAYPYDWRGFVGPKTKTSLGFLLSNPLFSLSLVIYPSPRILRDIRQVEGRSYESVSPNIIYFTSFFKVQRRPKYWDLTLKRSQCLISSFAPTTFFMDPFDYLWPAHAPLTFMILNTSLTLPLLHLSFFHILRPWSWSKNNVLLMDQITIKTPNPKCRLFLKIDLKRDLAAGVYLSEAPWGGKALL